MKGKALRKLAKASKVVVKQTFFGGVLKRMVNILVCVFLKRGRVVNFVC